MSLDLSAVRGPAGPPGGAYATNETTKQRSRFAVLFRYSSSHCSRRFGASRSLRSLDPATSDGWCCAHAGACSGRSLYQSTDLRLCLRKTLGRRLPARSTLRSSSSAKLRSSSRHRPRRCPRGARATRDALPSATSSTKRAGSPRTAGIRAVTIGSTGLHPVPKTPS